ncbi:NACHT domain-containing NTPase [Sulfurimonas sp.]|uniref:NACHT domain-containing protein n=1 Tax=Sulfurimonas sp. TaxID=2022749 RepID=UPI003567CCCC
MTYIDLHLEKLDSNEQSRQFKFYEILEQSNCNVIVVLGAPGSGKSSILKMYQESNQESVDIYNVKNFIDLEKTTTKPILFLDGLDEFRNTSSDKVFVIEKLGSKISSLKNTKVIISCREMDWYGEDDKNALRDEINKEVEIYRILPLNYSQQLELATKMQIDNPEEFVESLSDKGLISNPQMFVMMADLYIKNPKLKIAGKSELYKEYTKYTRENNPRYKRNKINTLSEEETFKFGGYLATFYIFSSIDLFNETILESIATTDFPLDKLNTILNTKLFTEHKFSHRTIAEFLAGNYLANNVLNSYVGLNVKRIKSLFTDSNKIPTELRGTYAWLCSISKNHELIAVDPYYQAIHGDNALFDVEQKKEIMKDIKQYAQTSPYFYKFNHKLDLQGFYDSRLEEFFIQELNDELTFKSHYIFFICSVLEGATEFGINLRKSIKAKILDSSIADYYRDNLIEVLNNEDDFLVEVLDKIKNNELDDENDRIKEAILRKLYPTIITPESVVQYLKTYSSKEIMSYCYFLEDTPYEKQRQLVDEIHQFSLHKKDNNQQLIIKDTIKHFVDLYFLNTVLKFDEELNAEEIYKILKYFKSKYYKDFESIDFDSFSWRLTDGQYDEKMQRLANELFKFYIKDELTHTKEERFRFFNFQYFFNLKNPNNQYETLLSFLSFDIDMEINKTLLLDAVSYAPRDEEKNIIPLVELQAKAKEFGLERELEMRLNPPKAEWEIEDEKRIEKQRKKEQKELEDNEEHFAKKSDEEIQKSFNDLHWFSKFVYFEREKKELKFITQKTYERLKELLRTSIFNEWIEPEILTIKHLAQNKSNKRNIDTMYYAALALNNDNNEIVEKIKDESFIKYLYIISLLSSNVGNIKRADFHEKVDNAFALATQKEYIRILVSNYIPKVENLMMKYIENETDIKSLKTLAMTNDYNQRGFKDSFIDEFLSVFNFNISQEDLTQLKLYSDDSNKVIIEVLECFTGKECKEFSMKMAIAMHGVFSHNNFEIFKLYPNPKKVSAVSKMMLAFNTEESIKSVNGIQSSKNICASFLTNQVLKRFMLEECEELLKEHENDIWTNKIKNAIDEKKQSKMDAQGYGHYSIEYVKDFLLKKSIVSEKDFFEDVCIKLNDLVNTIQMNRDNEKDKFYNVTQPKDEESCRDILLNDLKKYNNELVLTREKYEKANKRVDLNIKYKNNDRFEVQVECKKDKNQELLAGIEEQLIKQYLYESSNIQYGIYFIFYFAEIKQTPKQLLEELKNKIPSNYKNKIEIILLDLRK